MNATELSIRQKLKDDLEHYSKKCLTIRTKDTSAGGGAIQAFRFNSTQRIVHEKLNQQLEKKGKVRAIILKARQTGISTYVQARYYHKVTHNSGMLAMILTHLDDATQNLFMMTKRFHDNCPDPVKPTTRAANAKELYFDKLDSRYKTATAGSREVGRSDTVQLLHGSEVAFWPNAETHIQGLGQAISSSDGTESILESTANGVGNLFHKMWKAAERGEIEYEPIFIPWFQHEEYRAAPPAAWNIPEAFAEYEKIYDLDRPQTYWAFCKNKELAVSTSSPIDEVCWKFKQEYPANSDEAFQTSGENPFVPTEMVLRARKNTVEPQGALILGVDPARGGGDKTGLVDRQGRKLGVNICKRFDNDNLMVTCAAIVDYYKKYKPKKIIIDVTGLGGGLYDRLIELVPSRVVHPVNFASTANQPEKYKNRRSEIHGELLEWFQCEAGVDIPDSDELQGDICAPVWGNGATHTNSSGQLCLEPKDRIKSRLYFSPDLGDAAALTCALPMDDVPDEVEFDVNNFMAPVRVQGGWGAI